MVKASIIQLINSITVHKKGQDASPHKYALLLAIVELFDKKKILDNRLFLTEELELVFIQKATLLRQDIQKRDIHIEYPFYYMSLNGMWTLSVIPGKESDFNSIITDKNQRFTKRRILDNVEYAIISDELMILLTKKDDREVLKDTLIQVYNNLVPDMQHYFHSSEQLSTRCYIDYLSSLISTNPCNENAIAETQSVNALFHTIHVEHPLVNVLCEELQKNLGKHIILTGHAGDGKTTIAIDVLRRLQGLDSDIALEKPLLPREEFDDPKVSIIKDFSEREEQADRSLIDELKADNRRFLIVSNTGALLDFFRKHAENWEMSPIQAESSILSAISAEGGFQEVEFSGINFMVYNLALMDNLDLAKAIFTKILRKENWESCSNCAKSEYCPIRQNVCIIQAVQRQIVDRLFLIYRRLQEYGERLTIRQITSHLAYLICSGTNSGSIQGNMTNLGTEYLFFNRLYGDDGQIKDSIASEMKAISELRKQGFGKLLESQQEMMLWLKPVTDKPIAIHPLVEDIFSKLRSKGMSLTAADNRELSPENARMQIRRMMYFFIQDENQNRKVITAYLKSPNIMRWREWQKAGAILEHAYKMRYANMIYHVIQEYFTGIKIPEGIGYQDGRLYITISRKQSEVRQSAQIVVAEFDWSQNISLELLNYTNVVGADRAELALVGKGILEGIVLKLGLPFLDYVTQRHYGEIGDLLKASYRERLEQFKTQILDKIAYTKNEMMVVRLRNDNKFNRQKYAVKSQYLEVYDV